MSNIFWPIKSLAANQNAPKIIVQLLFSELGFFNFQFLNNFAYII